MNDPYRRRRRLEDDSSEGGGIPIIPLIIIIALVGLLLGAVLAHFFKGSSGPIAQTTPLPLITVSPIAAATPAQLETASPSPSPSLSPTASPTASPTPTPSASPAAQASPTPAATAVPVAAAPASSAPTPTPTPEPVATATPRAVAALKPAAVTPAAVVHTAPLYSGAQRAENTVRRYLEALSRGDAGTARTYLAQGDPDEASFMDSSAHLTSLRQSQNADGSYAVQADLTTSKGEYYITFTVQLTPDSAIITDHTAIKP